MTAPRMQREKTTLLSSRLPSPKTTTAPPAQSHPRPIPPTSGPPEGRQSPTLVPSPRRRRVHAEYPQTGVVHSDELAPALRQSPFVFRRYDPCRARSSAFQEHCFSGSPRAQLAPSCCVGVEAVTSKTQPALSVLRSAERSA
ncbi:hypothetical protein PENSPDRAFT_369972 [Peniophora sp. CONT]|nr:hypothetical protein PENSPDRAFT_369972 [Peniophora sp. CONT]